MTLQDKHARLIDYLRISVTDKCMLRCSYCMPPQGVELLRHGDILRYEEIVRVIRIAAGLGVRKIRLTGGEPLIRRNLTRLIASLRPIDGIEEITLTTNGVLLEGMARKLKTSGLDRINVSVDSFRPDRYREITGGGDLAAALRGIEEARNAGLLPVKINMVPMRGVNEDEILDFAKRTIDTDLHVRFIECMPAGGVSFWSPDRYIATEEIMQRIAGLGKLTPVRIRKNGPSKYFRLPGAHGVVGFISALTHHFCETCNRLRLTADGKLRPCLFSESEIDLRTPIRNGAADSEIERLLRLAVAVKPEGHRIGQQTASDHHMPPACSHAAGKRPMSKIGG